MQNFDPLMLDVFEIELFSVAPPGCQMEDIKRTA